MFPPNTHRCACMWAHMCRHACAHSHQGSRAFSGMCQLEIEIFKSEARALAPERVRRGEDISMKISHLDQMVSFGEELVAVVSSRKSLDFGPVWLSKPCLWLLAFGHSGGHNWLLQRKFWDHILSPSTGLEIGNMRGKTGACQFPCRCPQHWISYLDCGSSLAKINKVQCLPSTPLSLK